VRNEHDEVVEFRTAEPVLHIDVPEGRYVITVSCAPDAPPAGVTPLCGRLQ
jgi:hypothetical protein